MTAAWPLAIARQARRRWVERRPECQAIGSHAEAVVEALQERLGQGDFGEQDEGLAAVAQGGGDGLEIDLGLARAGDAVEQGRGEGVGVDRGGQGGGGGASVRRRASGRRNRDRGAGRGCRCRPRPLRSRRPSQAADDAVADVGDASASSRIRPWRSPIRSSACVRCGVRRGGSTPVARYSVAVRAPSSAELLGIAMRTTRRAGRDNNRRSTRPGGASGAASGGRVGDRDDVAQAVVADLRVRAHAFGLPHHAEQLARAERDRDDAAGFGVHAVRDAIVERAERGIEDEDAGAGHACCIWWSAADSG